MKALSKSLWICFSSNVIFTHPRITLIEDDVMLPNGKKTKYLRFEKYSDVASIICLNADEKILVQMEYSYQVNDFLYQFPGGSIPRGENIEEGIARELMEEASYYPKTLILLGKYYVSNRRSNAMAYTFVGRNLEKRSLPSDTEESFENFWFTEKEIDNLIRDGQILHQHFLASWSLYKAYKDNQIANALRNVSSGNIL